jgi:hypothetical protein
LTIAEEFYEMAQTMRELTIEQQNMVSGGMINAPPGSPLLDVRVGDVRFLGEDQGFLNGMMRAMNAEIALFSATVFGHVDQNDNGLTWFDPQGAAIVHEYVESHTEPYGNYVLYSGWWG